MPTKKAARKGAAKKGAAARKTPKRSAPRTAARGRPAARPDRGEGEAAVQARIKALTEPARSILTKLHPLVTKHGEGLEPSVKWGFAVYSRSGKMLLVAAPRKAYVSFGFTTDAEKAGVGKGYVEYRSVDDVKEAQVATWAMLASAGGA